MNPLEIRSKINQKLSLLSPEQLNSVWEFMESLESPLPDDNLSTKTVLEKMGGYPKYLLDSTHNLSDRDIRKQIIAEHIQKRHQNRHQ